MTTDEALQLLGHLCAASVAGALREIASEVEVGVPALAQTGGSPFDGIPVPGIAASVELDDGLAGDLVLAVSQGAAQLLAGAQPEEEPAAEAGAGGEADVHAAVGKAAAHVSMAVAATAGGILGHDVPIGEPVVTGYASETEAAGPSERSPHAFLVPFTIEGEPGCFVQSVQNAFLVKATPGLGEIALQGDEAGAGDSVSDAMLREVKVRMWAELGRAQLPLAQAVSLPSGAVVPLDRGADDPVELYVNGRLFAHGRLITLQNEWAVEIERLVSGRRGETPRVVGRAALAAAAPAQPDPPTVDNARR